MSIFNTDLGELYNQWGERVAYNEGYTKQQVDSARIAGKDAFDLGVGRSAGMDAYFSARSTLENEAQNFQFADSALGDEEIEDFRVGAEADELAEMEDSDVLQAAEDDEQINEFNPDFVYLDEDQSYLNAEWAKTSGLADFENEITDYHSYNMANL